MESLISQFPVRVRVNPIPHDEPPSLGTPCQPVGLGTPPPCAPPEQKGSLLAQNRRRIDDHHPVNLSCRSVLCVDPGVT